MSDPTPAASSPGTRTTPSMRAAEAGRLHQQERTDDRRAEQRRDRGEAAGDADDHRRHRRRVLLEQVDREDAEAAADRDERSLGTEDDAEAQRGERGEDDAGQLDRRDRTGGVEAVGR